MNQDKFPPCLAYGILKPESIRTEGDSIVADYYFLDEKVQEVRFTGKWVEFIECLRDQCDFRSTHTSLKNALLHHFNIIPFSKSKVMHQIAQKTVALGNIYFSMNDNKLRLSYFPAGRLFVFSIPFTDHQKFLQAKTLLVEKTGKELFDAYPSTMHTIAWNNNLYVNDIYMLEFLIPMHSLYKTASLIMQQKVVSNEKKLRMVINDVSNKTADSFMYFPSSGKDEWKAFGILFKKLKELRLNNP